jgi:hypothetical protein
VKIAVSAVKLKDFDFISLRYQFVRPLRRGSRAKHWSDEFPVTPNFKPLVNCAFQPHQKKSLTFLTIY